MNEAFVRVWFNIRLCYHKLMTSHMMRPQPFFFVVTLVVVVVGGYILVIHLSHMLYAPKYLSGMLSILLLCMQLKTLSRS